MTNASNTFDNPDAVQPPATEPVSIIGRRATVRVPAHSISRFTAGLTAA